MSDNRWEINNLSENDIIKRIELLLDKATQTMYDVENTRMMVTIMMLLIIGLTVMHVIK